MGDSGSDTETDDELLERLQASRTHRKHAPDAPAGGAVVSPAKSERSDQRDAADQQSFDGDPPAATAVRQQETARRDQGASGFPAFLLNSVDEEASAPTSSMPPPSIEDHAHQAHSAMVFSDDDEPPRFDPVDEAATPTGNLTAPLPPSEELCHARDTEPTVVSVKQDQTITEEPIAQAPPQQAVPRASFTVAPDRGQFISPFSSLANQYRPPPPPVVGAPPKSYVPGRPLVNAHSQIQSETPPPASAVRIKCFACSRMLPPISSPIPVDGHTPCSCCQRYYMNAVTRTDGSGDRFCTSCVVATTRAAPSADQPSATLQSVPRPMDPLPSAPPSHLAASLAHQTVQCSLCNEHVCLIPPKSAADCLVCECCMHPMSKTAFSKKQRRPSHPMRRCLICVTSRTRPAKFENVRTKKRLRTAVPASNTAIVQDSRTFSTESAIELQFTPEERREMEIEVRNYKLAKRSINRRRMANDLRGSTRIEYEARLAEEERKVEKEMAIARRINPILFDELSRKIKVKSVSVAPQDRDNTSTKKPTKRSPKQPKPPRKSASATPQKRKSSEASGSTPGKRPRASASTVPTSGKSLNTVDSEPQSPVGKRVVPTRSRTGVTSKPIEVIDLVDSD